MGSRAMSSQWATITSPFKYRRTWQKRVEIRPAESALSRSMITSPWLEAFLPTQA